MAYLGHKPADSEYRQYGIGRPRIGHLGNLVVASRSNAASAVRSAGDNFLSVVVLEIEASQEFKNNGLSVFRWDETEGGDSSAYTIALGATRNQCPSMRAS